ncbi:PDR/VanB family oxidoreductase [Segniliparus rugosus]|uniref:Ferredoxin n=1 Tax=Segniliparus rugosus (strain ATCC BAA-974 / DSM 45345 / CCUG 50838 / CIP 108380 / JCM 13579 / CDC 945) TaxID=679197 RepID=E5XR90_SEGRC|nr:PDR/VanB family oxidoreductase [Segniliparus rugosus]EFV13131.1 hypothetical protein HMPREF9336_02012 [Segniliparus rugosus ATCC BAA-974]
MSLGFDLKEVPGDLYGKRRQEPALCLMALAAPYLPRLAKLTGLLVRATELEPRPVLEQRLVVRERELIAVNDDVVSLLLEAPDRAALPRWWPGAHIAVRLPSGLVRHYSLCGDPADTRSYRIAVRRVPDGAGSAEIHETLLPGAVLTVQGPRNAFPLLPAAMPTGPDAPISWGPRRIRFVAGGIGITPILPMLDYAERKGMDWSLFYSGRSRESMPFLGELERYDGRVVVRSDDVDGVPAPSEIVGDVDERDAIYCCGPPAMVTAAASALADRPAVGFHVERFVSAPIVDGKAFEVELASSGEVLHVSGQRSILDVVREARPDVSYACRQGFCGTCRVKLLSGDPEHLDNRLTSAQRQNGDMLICVSRAAGEGDRLVLDL